MDFSRTSHTQIFPAATGWLTACVALIISLSAAAATWEGEAIAGRIVRDMDNKQTYCAEIYDRHQATVDLGKLEPGLYQLTLTGRFLGQPNVRYSLNVAHNDGDAFATTRPFPAYARKSYSDISHTWLVTDPKSGKLRLWLSDHARQEDAEAVTDQRLRNMQKPTIGADDDDDEFKLEDRPVPEGIESFLLRRITLERLPVPLVVTKVWPDKIHYFPEQPATIDVSVHNLTNQPTQGILTITKETALDNRLQLLKEEVSVPPGQSITRTVTSEHTARYGHEIEATITPVPPARPHTLSDFYSVTENVFEVSLQGWGRIGVSNDQESMRQKLNMPQEQLDKLSADSAIRARQGYYNHIEFFSWAPDDFFNLSPEDDAWWSGTMTYIKVKRDIIAELRALQAQGIKVLSYAQPYAIGLDTQRTLRTHPEIFAYGHNGAPSVSYDYDIMKSRARLDMGLRPRELGGSLNFFDIRTVDRGIDAMIDCWKMFGFDGVRYDNRYYRANNPITIQGTRATNEKDLDQYSARNVRRLKDRFWKEIGPRWLISHNNGYRFHTDGNKEGWKETVKDGLMCMDEETCGATSPRSNLNNHLAYAQFATEGRRFCTKLGGFYQLFPPGRADTVAVDMAVYPAICAATGSHPITCDLVNSASGDYGRFLTRYSAFIYPLDLKPVAETTGLLTFPGIEAGTVHWQGFVSERASADGRWLLFPLLMAQKEDRFGTNIDSSITTTPESITVQLKTTGAANRRYRLLSPELPGMERDLAPIQSPDGKVTLTLPQLTFYGLLVVEETQP